MSSRPNIPSDARLSLATAVVSTSIPGETVVLDPAGNRYYSLDGVGQRVWEMLQSTTTLNHVVSTLLGEYEVDPAACERDVRSLVEKLVHDGIVVVNGSSR